MLFQPPAPQSPNPPRGALPFSRVGPIGLIAFGVFVLLAFLAFVRMMVPPEPPAKPGESGGGATGDVAPDTFPREPKIDFLDDAELAAQYPTTVREELEAELREWYGTTGREHIADQQDVLEAEWVRHLMSDEVRPRLERLPGWVFGPLESPERVQEEPGPHRGRLVQAWGAVASVDEIPLPTDPVRPAWRVRLDDVQGRPWTIVTLQDPGDAAKPGAWVKAFGAFAKLRPVEGGRPSFVLFAPQKLLPSYPPVKVEAISPEWLENVEDATVERSRRMPGEEEPFWLLMNYVRTMGADGYAAKVASGELKVTDLTGTRGATDLAQRPAVHRFELVRLRVGISRGEGAFVTDAALPENPGGIRDAVRGYVLDDQGRTIWVITPHPIESLQLANARLAMIEGFFYKRIAVDRRDGPRGLYWMPVIVATSIRPVFVGDAATHWVDWIVWTLAIGGVLLAVLLVVLVMRGRKQSQESLRRQAERMARRQAKRTGDRPPAP